MNEQKQRTYSGMTSGAWHCDHCGYASEDAQGNDYGVSWGLPRGSVVCPGCWGKFYTHLYYHHREFHGNGFQELSPEARSQLRKVSAQWIADRA